MTVEQYRALSKRERVAAWVRMSVEERREMWGQLAAQTPRWGLDYPEDYNDPADTPTVMRALALDTDTALSTVYDTSVALIATEHQAMVAADAAQRAYIDQQDNWLNATKSAVNHTHAPSASGIVVGTWDVGTLAPGEEKQQIISKTAGSAVLVTVQHHSTYIFAVCNTLNETQAYLKVRNSTTATTHDNVKLYFAIIPNA